MISGCKPNASVRCCGTGSGLRRKEDRVDREPRVRSDELGESDFADEHDSAGFAGEEPDEGPEHARDESVPAGLAGADPTATDEQEAP